MTVIIKSNQTATKSLGNIFGLSKTDYSLLLDFNLSEYHKKSGGVTTTLPLTDILTFSRASPAYYLDATDSYRLAETNEMRISHDKRTGTKGLLIEAATTNLLANPFLPATQTVSLTKAPNTAYVLSVKGTGSAKVSGSVIVSTTLDTKTATEAAPATFYTNATGVITVTVTGSLTAFEMHITSDVYGGITAITPPPVGTTTARDIAVIDGANLKSIAGTDLKNCTVVMRTIHNPVVTGLTDSIASNSTVMTLADSSVNYKGVHAYEKVGGLNGFFVTAINTGSTSVGGESVPTLGTPTVVDYIVSYNNAGANITFYRNGTIRDVVSAGFSFNLDKITIGHDTGFHGNGAAINSIITAIVVYPYKMTRAEMEGLFI